MQLNTITPLILTYNEESNIAQCLTALSWASRIIVLDSGSEDQTKSICESFSSVKFITREFDNHANQWNFGLGLVNTDWVLTLDADYICPPELPDELRSLPEASVIYYAQFRFFILGHALRRTLYPPRAILFPPKENLYFQDGHTQQLATDNRRCGFLKSIIVHNDLKPLKHWLSSQEKYAELESHKLCNTKHLGWKDRIRKTIFFAPALTFFYCILWQGHFLRGSPGLYYTMQRVYAELLLSLHLLDRLIRSK